jgi:hypothetical protein
VKPFIEDTSFGSITVAGKTYEHDVVINLKGEVNKRKKKLSKEIYGTSHKVSLKEAGYIMNEEAELVIIGNGQYGVLELSEEARDFFRGKKCKTKILPTPEAVKAWNKESGKVVGMFHVTC